MVGNNRLMKIDDPSLACGIRWGLWMKMWEVSEEVRGREVMRSHRRVDLRVRKVKLWDVDVGSSSVKFERWYKGKRTWNMYNFYQFLDCMHWSRTAKSHFSQHTIFKSVLFLPLPVSKTCVLILIAAERRCFKFSVKKHRRRTWCRCRIRSFLRNAENSIIAPWHFIRDSNGSKRWHPDLPVPRHTLDIARMNGSFLDVSWANLLHSWPHIPYHSLPFLNLCFPELTAEPRPYNPLYLPFCIFHKTGWIVLLIPHLLIFHYFQHFFLLSITFIF